MTNAPREPRTEPAFNNAQATIARGSSGPGDTGRPLSTDRHARAGLALALFSYTAWGFFPLYFRAVKDVNPLEVLAHRVVWAACLLIGVVLLTGRREAAFAAIRDRATLFTLLVSTLLIGVNWYLYIWAVGQSRVLETSLGYFINPLVSVLLGVIVLKERLTLWQIVALALAAFGVLYLTIAERSLPWISLTLACSFGLYALLRKAVRADALVGLTIETVVLTPLALAYLLWSQKHGTLSLLQGSTGNDLLLIAAGPLTALPLLTFSAAARRLRLSTMGFLQYIAPSLQFMLAVAVFHEPLKRSSLIAFAGIWAGLVLYCVDAARRARAPRV